MSILFSEQVLLLLLTIYLYYVMIRHNDNSLRKLRKEPNDVPCMKVCCLTIAVSAQSSTSRL